MATSKLISPYWVAVLVLGALTSAGWLGFSAVWVALMGHLLTVLTLTVALRNERARRTERAIANLTWTLGSCLPGVGVYFAFLILFYSKISRTQKPRLVPALLDSMKLDARITQEMTREWIVDQFKREGTRSLFQGTPHSSSIDLTRFTSLSDQRKALLSLRHARSLTEVRLLQNALLSAHPEIRNLANLILTKVDRELQNEISESLRGSTHALTDKSRERIIQNYLILVTSGLVSGALKETYLNRALQLTDEGLKQSPDNPILWYRRGRILIAQRNFNDAVESLERAIALLPEDPRFYAWLAEVSYLKGNWKLAELHSKHALKLGFQHHTITDSLRYWENYGKG